LDTMGFLFARGTASSRALLISHSMCISLNSTCTSSSDRWEINLL
jgi:hypothetical protein